MLLRLLCRCDAVISSIMIGAATSQQFGFHESLLLRIGKHRRDSDREQLVLHDRIRKRRLHIQTYLDRLRRFVESRYSTSEIYQSNPTIVLELNHIKIRPRPGSRRVGSLLQNSQRDVALAVDRPNDFNTALENANKSKGYLIKPQSAALRKYGPPQTVTFTNIITLNGPYLIIGIRHEQIKRIIFLLRSLIFLSPALVGATTKYKRK